MELFSNDWLSCLYEETDGFSRHALVENLVLKPKELMYLIQEALSSIRNKEDKAILRIFVDNGQRYDLLENLRNTVYEPSQDLEGWIAKTIGYKDFCFTFNGITKWNDKLHSSLTQEVITPIVDKLGAPFAGIDTYAFIANSGYTPFGIHDDLDHSLIFHLGPEEKNVWIWPEGQYLELTGSRDRRFDVEKLEKHAEHLVLKPGDCLFIPRGDIHVFKNVGYSAFLGFVLFPSDAKKVTNEAVSILSTIYGNRSVSNAHEGDFSSCLVNQVDTVMGGKREKAFDKLRLAAMYKHLLLKSNGYIIHKPYLQKIGGVKLQDAKLTRPDSFPILYHQQDNRLALFIRGRFMEMKYAPAILEVVKILNSTKSQMYGDLLKEITKILPHEVGEAILQRVIAYKGLLLETS